MSWYGSGDDQRQTTRAGTHRLVAALAVLGGTIIAAAAAVPRLTNLSGTVNLVSPQDPYVRLDDEMTAEFGMENPVIWVLEDRSGSIWNKAFLARLQTMTREAFTIPGVIAPDVLSLASPNLRDVRQTDNGLEQVYLMGDLPETPAALAALRQRVEGDEKFRGTLVSADGRAAMLIANFRAESDSEAIAKAALALRDRYRDGQVTAYVTGAPVLRLLATEEVRRFWPWLVVLLGGGIAVLAFPLGLRTLLAMLFAAALASTWALIAVVTVGVVALPWSAYALPATVLIAAGVAVAGVGSDGARVPLALASGLLVSLAPVAAVTESPVRAFGVAGAIGAACAVAAGITVCALLTLPARRTRTARWLPPVALVLVAVTLPGLARLRTSFSLQAYAEHYLPAASVADLKALVHLLPPPTTLAVRVRGEPGFVASPTVLQTFDALAASARSDPAVRSTMSVADLVKMVNRAFNDNRSEFSTIPEDRLVVGRYLALAYSPGFRQFVDRALATAVIWIYLDSQNPVDVARVVERLKTQLAAQPVPGADVDLVGGDGAEILVMARVARQLALGGMALLLIVPLVVGVFVGAAGFWRSLLSGVAAVAVAGGTLGGLSLPIDLVSLPFLISVGLAGAAFGALGVSREGDGLGRLSLGLALMAGVALGAPMAGLGLFGACLLGVAVATALASADQAAWRLRGDSSRAYLARGL